MNTRIQDDTVAVHVPDAQSAQTDTGTDEQLRQDAERGLQMLDDAAQRANETLLVELDGQMKAQGKLTAGESRELITVRQQLGGLDDEYLEHCRMVLKENGRLRVGQIHRLIDPAVIEQLHPPRKQVQQVVKAGVPTEKELLDMARGVAKPNADPLDILRAGLVYCMMDPLILNIRSRGQVLELLSQASRGVDIITSLAAHLKIVFHDKPVEPSSDYSEWTSDQLFQLAHHISTHVDHVVIRGESGMETGRLAEQRIAALEQQVENERKRVLEQTQIAEAVREQARTQALQINTMVASYRDQETFVVAQVDAVSGSPIKYAKLEDDPEADVGDKITNVSTLARSSKFSTWEEANGIRLRLQRVIRNRGKSGRLNVIAGDEPIIRVMQLSMRPVTVEDVV